MINYNKVAIEFSNNNATLNEIYRNLQVLYTTPEGTVPWDRGFGIKTELLDAPLPIARGKITIEYINKTKKYEPRAKVIEVNFQTDIEKGTLIPRVVIDIESE